MKKVLLGTFIGFLLFALGLVAGYYAIGSIRNGGSPLLVLGSIVLGGIGIIVLYKSGRMDTFKSKIKPLGTASEEKAANSFEKKQEAVKEWNESSDNRDKLKLLEATERAKQEE